jgi:nucleotide-binding universal stress UspA family protein
MEVRGGGRRELARTTSGGPAHAIGSARAGRPDLMVSGSRGHTTPTGLIVGGTVQWMLRVAP